MSSNKDATGLPHDFIENPTTIADMLRNGLSIGLPRQEDHAGLEKMYQDRDEAHKRGDWALLRSTIDFPMILSTDHADEQAETYIASEEQVVETVGRAMSVVPRSPVDHNRRFVFLSDHLVINLEENSVKVGTEVLHFKAAHLVVKRDGKWKVKAVIEGGWSRAYRLSDGFAR